MILWAARARARLGLRRGALAAVLDSQSHYSLHLVNW